jgi:hypothetical protein
MTATLPRRFPSMPAIAVSAIAALLSLLGLPLSAATVSLPEPTLYLPVGLATADVLLHVHVAGAEAECAPALTVKDLAPAPLPQVAVGETPLKVPSGPTDCDWYFPLKLTNIPPKLTQERHLDLTLGKTSRVLPYVLANQSFAWTVKSPSSAWPVRGATGRTWQLGVVEGPAQKVRLAFCRLDGPMPFDCGQLQLCVDSPDLCKPAFDLPKGRSTLFLKLKEGFQQPGTYDGNVFLTADTRPESETLPLKISYTSWRWQLLGIICILVGVVLGWFVTVYARARILRDRALFAVAALGQTAQKLRQDLESLPPGHAGQVHATKAALDDLLASLSPSALDGQGFLPTVFGGAGDAAAYQTFLTGVGNRLAMLKVIVGGMVTALTIPVTPTPADPDPYGRALQALDRLDANIQPPSADIARTQVQQILATLLPPAAASAGMAASPAPPTPESLRIDIERIGWASWVAWLVITVVVGYLAQVDKAGFGTPADFFVCLLWGFGIPAAGQQLTQLTPATIATTLKVPVI